VVSPEGIDPDGEPEGRSRGADAFRGETNERIELVSRIFASWNQLDGWLRQVDGLRQVA
jgi:hypothetical protein